MTEVFSKSPLGLACAQITQQLIAHPMSVIFRSITDEGYLAHVRQPMDLNTVKKKLKDGHYTTCKEWCADIELIFDNSIDFNGAETITGGIAIFMKEKAKKYMKKLNLYNHQNFEEAIRSIFREISATTEALVGQRVQTTPRYSMEQLCASVNSYYETGEVEQLIKKHNEQRVLKKAKDGIVSLENLPRKTLDAMWEQFGAK